MELNLTANNRNEELVLEYLKNTVTDILAEKINTGKKTLQGCWKYIVSEAQKKAVDRCAAIESNEVFGWAVHYFEEDSIEECKTAPTVKTANTAKPKAEKKPTPKAEVKTEPKTEAKPKSKKVDEGQISFFDMCG
jgi:hypothetical protein